MKSVTNIISTSLVNLIHTKYHFGDPTLPGGNVRTVEDYATPEGVLVFRKDISWDDVFDVVAAFDTAGRQALFRAILLQLYAKAMGTEEAPHDILPAMIALTPGAGMYAAVKARDADLAAAPKEKGGDETPPPVTGSNKKKKPTDSSTSES